MARRGTLTALQAALAGIGGAAGGYVQQQELKRKQLEEQRQRESQDFLTRFSLAQAGARQRQAPVPGAPETPGMPKPSDYQTIGTFGGVEYEALTPEAKALQARQERVAGIEAEIGARTTAETKRWESAKPQVIAALDKIEKKYLPQGIRELALSGGFGLDPAKAIQTAFEIANQNRTTDVAATRAGRGEGTDGPSLTSLRMTAAKDFEDETGNKPTAKDEAAIRQRVNLYRPGTYATMDSLYGNDTEVPKATAPTISAPTGGMFARDMFSSPTAAESPRANTDEIRALAARLAELSKGRMGSIADREAYARNAPERSRVQAALNTAQLNYRR